MLDAFYRVRIEQEGVLFGENAELYFWHACGQLVLLKGTSSRIGKLCVVRVVSGL